jgi:hypothetical protein
MDEWKLPDEDPGENRDAAIPGPGGAPAPDGPAAVPEQEFDHDHDHDHERVPEEWEIEGPAVSISLGDATDLDPELLAAICGPDGLGGQSLSALYGQDRAADVLRPTPVLAALTEQAVGDAAALTDDELTGALRAARRLENRAVYLQTVAVAELGRRREAELASARARGVPAGCRSGEFPADELAAELVMTQGQAANCMAEASHLATRIPATLAGMAAGVIDYARAATIVLYTLSLSPADAARADEILATAAPALRTDQLARKAATLEMKLDPEAARARKEHARQTRQRVEVRREDSGNASLSGRELATADVMAAKAHIDAVAARLRAEGQPGTLDQLRALAFTDLAQGLDPLDRIAPAPAPGPDASGAAPAGGECGDDECGDDEDHEHGEPEREDDAEHEDEDGTWIRRDPATPGDGTRRRVPLPAMINLIVPVGTLLGWSGTPAQAAGWGLLDPDETRDIVAAASRHPRTRWCYTFTGPDGTAVAHACAKGQHPWTPPDFPNPRNGPRPQRPPRRDPAQAARLAELLRTLNATPEPIARGTCDHRHAEDRYTPSRKLKHLIRARTATCSAPGCNGQAIYCDLDHVIPYPDGPTDECNIHPACRRHHRCKQAPGWHVKETRPGVMDWTTPAGRTHTTTPTAYDA